MWRQLYVLCHTLVQATVGIGTVIIVYIGVAYTKGGGGVDMRFWEEEQGWHISSLDVVAEQLVVCLHHLNYENSG